MWYPIDGAKQILSSPPLALNVWVTWDITQMKVLDKVRNDMMTETVQISILLKSLSKSDLVNLFCSISQLNLVTVSTSYKSPGDRWMPGTP